MADDRVLPPTPRRIALARRAGLVARSPILVAGAAWAGAAIALWVAMRRAGAVLETAIRAGATAADPAAASAGAIRSGDVGGAAHAVGGLAPADVIGAVLGLVAPIVIGAMIGGVALHVAQTRALAIPRRRVDGAPRPGRGVDRRAADAGVRLIRAGLVGATAIGWTWVHLADLGHVGELPTSAALAGAGVLGLGAIAHLAAALLVAGALDLGVAVLRHRADLRMTRREQVDDARAAGLDPRWRAGRRRGDARDATAAIASARVLVTGDGAAAVRYHERLWPRPIVVAVGRGIDATRLIELARRHRITIHHDPSLARALADAGVDGAVPDRWLESLADVVAADDESGVVHSRA